MTTVKDFESPIDAKQAAQYLGIHHKSIYRHMKKGTLTCYHRLGRNVYFFRSELDKFLRES